MQIYLRLVALSLTTLFSCVFTYSSFANTPTDSVFQLARIVTHKKVYPKIVLSRRNEFPLKDKFSTKNTNEQISYFSDRNIEVAASIAIGNNYFPYIKSELEKANLPTSFQWIPFTLSGMINEYEDESGRAGLWQLPYVVGIQYGLRQDRYFDERKDFKKNTNVAIRYLKDLIEEFNDTTLALTAYFNGRGITKYALRTAQPHSHEVIYGLLPPQTRNKIYQWNAFAAALSFSRNRFMEKFTPTSIAALERVQLEDNTHIMAIAKILDIPSPSFKAMNPTIVNELIPKGTHIKLPLGKKQTYLDSKTKIIVYQDSIVLKPKKRVIKKPGYVAPPKNAEKIYYKIRPGDNLGAIAQKFHVGIRQLRGWNGLTNDRIYAGQKLVIYGPKNKSYNTSKPTTQKPKTTHTQTSNEGTFIIYTVKSGDTLWGIAQKYPGVSAEDIQSWNKIGEGIDVGQKIKIKKK